MILDLFSSTPKLVNDILPLYIFRNWDTPPGPDGQIGHLVTQIWEMIYYLYIIPEIGILDWLYSNPKLGNDMLFLYNSRNRDTRSIF